MTKRRGGSFGYEGDRSRWPDLDAVATTFVIVPRGTLYPGPHSDPEVRRGRWLIKARFHAGAKYRDVHGTTFVVEPGTDARALIFELTKRVCRALEFVVFDDRDQVVHVPGQRPDGVSFVLGRLRPG